MDFEWHFPEDDKWQTWAAPSPEGTTSKRRAQRVGSSLLAIALLAIAGWLVVPQHRSELPAELALMAPDLQQVLAQQSGRGQPAGDNPAPALTGQIQVVEREHRWAIVETLVLPTLQTELDSSAGVQTALLLAATVTPTLPAGLRFGYRETHFYRQTKAGWQRLAPPVALWGEPELLQTAHLRFVFRTLDRVTVARVAAESEGLYTDLRRLLGLPPAQEASVTVEVVPHAVVGDWQRREQRLLLPSPLLLRLPIDASRSTVLGQRLRAALIYATLQEALQQPLARWQRQPLVDGLWRWLRETDTLPFPLPAALTCTEKTSCLPDALPKLSQLQVLLAPDWIDDSGPQPQIATAQTLIEYIVATYGAASLPVFLRAFGQHEEWTTLVPAAFGVSVAEFEAGWHTYLSKQKGDP